jgi:hypothetical protein
VESAAEEDAVNRSDDRSPIRGDGRQGQQSHNGQTVDDLAGTQTTLRSDEAEKVRPGARVAAVGKVLQARSEQPASRAHQHRTSGTTARGRWRLDGGPLHRANPSMPALPSSSNTHAQTDHSVDSAHQVVSFVFPHSWYLRAAVRLLSCDGGRRCVRPLWLVRRRNGWDR